MIYFFCLHQNLCYGAFVKFGAGMSICRSSLKIFLKYEILMTMSKQYNLLSIFLKLIPISSTFDDGEWGQQTKELEWYWPVFDTIFIFYSFAYFNYSLFIMKSIKNNFELNVGKKCIKMSLDCSTIKRAKNALFCNSNSPINKLYSWVPNFISTPKPINFMWEL